MPGARVAGAVRYAARLARLGPSPTARAKIFATTLYLVARHRLRLRAGGLIRLRFAAPDGSFPLLVDEINDLHAVEEVLIRGQYDSPPLDRAETIVDLGSHIGVSVAFFRSRYPEARIFAFEPNPASFRKLEQNARGQRDVTVRQLAISSRRGPTRLRYGATAMRASLAQAPGDSVEIDAATLDDVVGELGLERIDLLKIDVEGAELEILDGFEALDRVGAMVGELHPGLIEAPVERFFSLLDDFAVETEPAGEDVVFRAIRQDR